MEMYIKRQYKGNVILSILFYGELFLIALLPMLTYGEGFWLQNTFMTIIGGILGFSWYLVGFCYVYLNVFSFKPKLWLNNTIQIFNLVVVLFTLDVALLETQLFSIETSVWLFVILGLFVISANAVVLMINRSKNEKDYLIVKEQIEKMEVYDEESIDVIFLSLYVFAGLFGASLVLDFGNVTEFLMIFLFNAFYMYRYVKVIKLDKNSQTLTITVSIILFAITVLMLVMFGDFLHQHVVLISLTVLLPVIHTIPTILKMYYSFTLKEILKK